MSLEDFGREVMGKPPKNRDMVDRWVYTDEDGCSFDRQVWVSPLPLGVGFAMIGGLLLIGWASDDPAWHALAAKFQSIVDFVKSIVAPV